MNPVETLTVPATARANEQEADAVIDVEAEYCPYRSETRYEPAEPAGYEIFSAKLQVDANLRGLVTDRVTLWVQGGREVEIDIDPEQLAKVDAIDLDDESLRDELAAYLNNT